MAAARVPDGQQLRGSGAPAIKKWGVVWSAVAAGRARLKAWFPYNDVLIEVFALGGSHCLQNARFDHHVDCPDSPLLWVPQRMDGWIR